MTIQKFRQHVPSGSYSRIALLSDNFCYHLVLLQPNEVTMSLSTFNSPR